MAKLSETFTWATSVDITKLRQSIRTAGVASLRAIGSGGSLTAAHALAAFHQRFTGQLAAVSTPLEAVDEPLECGVSHWLISAGGTNVDILAAASALIRREPRQLAIICGRVGSPLAELGQEHGFTDLLMFPPPTGKDGFLSTNSLLAFTALLARAYSTEFGAEDHWKQAVEFVNNLLDAKSDTLATWETEAKPLWSRSTTLVLYGPSARIGAVDLESKFTEAAVGNLQLADYRNFAHGRHHWLAKRSDISAVIALITDADQALAERTLDLLPQSIPQARFRLPGGAMATALLSLIAAFHICGWAGAARGIDPGRPGVPDFGRRLYNLPLPRSRSNTMSPPSPRDAAAIERKAGNSIERLFLAGELPRWQSALNAFRSRMWKAQFAGVVVDYDGTVVDTRERFHPPVAAMSAELVRLLEAGAYVAVATGRGASVRRDLQTCIPAVLWSRVLVGYYNGAEIALLSEDGAPDGREETCAELAPLAAALRAQPELVGVSRQTDRPYQITLEATRALPEGRLWDLAQQVILLAGATHVCVTRSSHSIDILASSVSKLNVILKLQKIVGESPLLTIGDRGRWPGNDYQLLRGPWSLGVDEISVDPNTCWNLAKSGQRGPAATLEYLHALDVVDGRLCFQTESLR
jgi:fructoselysine-6-P-deglycase FrlB-like protein